MKLAISLLTKMIPRRMDNKISVFSTAYLPPVQYLTHWVNSENKVLEKHCNYAKQTYRNRCDILGANGPISLIVPVEKGRRLKVQTKDIEIAYHERWQALHWRSIISAYQSSPFFEYYMDDFAPFYEKNYKFLIDFNNDLFQMVLSQLDLPQQLDFTPEFELNYNDELYSDLRNTIHPKLNYKEQDTVFEPIPYRQVFSHKFDFVPNLSVIDLLFNKGPEAIDWLEDGIRKS